MPELPTLAPELAALLEAAIEHLGQLGQPAIDALVDRLASAPECSAYDAAVDLLG